MTRIIRRSLYALACAAAFASAAHAQEGRDHQPSPERRAAFEAAHQACAADLQTLCPGQDRRAAMTCLRQNLDKASDGCKSAVASLPQRRH